MPVVASEGWSDTIPRVGKGVDPAVHQMEIWASLKYSLLKTGYSWHHMGSTLLLTSWPGRNIWLQRWETTTEVLLHPSLDSNSNSIGRLDKYKPARLALTEVQNYLADFWACRMLKTGYAAMVDRTMDANSKSKLCVLLVSYNLVFLKGCLWFGLNFNFNFYAVNWLSVCKFLTKEWIIMGSSMARHTIFTLFVCRVFI